MDSTSARVAGCRYAITDNVSRAACEIRRRSAPRYAVTARALSGAVTKRQASPSRCSRSPLEPRSSSSAASACSTSRGRAPVARTSSPTVTGFSATNSTASIAERSSFTRLTYSPALDGDVVEQRFLVQVDDAAAKQIQDREERHDRKSQRRPLQQQRTERNGFPRLEQLLDLDGSFLHAVALTWRDELWLARGPRQRQHLLPRRGQRAAVTAARW